ncbi:MAG: helix-turn-helix domain-containing protein [bacterium]|nr:helix-turn-helix domain-containing protein [bacterium]
MAAKAKRKAPGTPRKLTARQRAEAKRAMARRITEARRESGLTQAVVAKAVRLSPSLVSKIERGERRLDPLELARFARLYGKSIVDFID